MPLLVLSHFPLPWRGSALQDRVQKAAPSFPSRRPAGFLNLLDRHHSPRRILRSEATGVAILEQLEWLDAVEVSVKKLAAVLVEITLGMGIVRWMLQCRQYHRARGMADHRDPFRHPDECPARLLIRTTTTTGCHHVTASFSGPLSPGGTPDGVPTPSLNTSAVGDEA